MTYYLQRGSEMKQTKDAALAENHTRKGWIENPPPAYDSATQNPPEWNGGQWVIPDKTAAVAPPAERYQVKEYLMRNGIPLDSIPAMIASVTPEGIEREVALMRWNDVNKFPKEHPLVTAVAAALNLDLDQVWASILAIE